MSIEITAGAWNFGSTSFVVALPTGTPQAGDIHVLFVGCKPYSATINTPSGWTPITNTNGTNGTVANGTDVGSVAVAAFYRIWQSGDGNPTVSITTGNTALGVIHRFRPSAGSSLITPVGEKGFDVTSDASFSCTMGSDIGITAGDAVVGYSYLPGNNRTFGSPTLSATGVTFGTVTGNPATEGTTATGLDCEASACTALVSAGPSSAAAIVGWTLSGAQTGMSNLIRIRETSPTFDQDAFRLRNDNGDEATATWKGTANQNASINVDENFRCRFVVQETGGIGLANAGFKFECKLNAGSWTPVTAASSVVQAVASPNFTDGVDCVQRVGAGTFVADNDGMDEDGAVAEYMDFTGSDEAEIEGCFQLVGADVSNGDTVQLRVVRYDGSALDSYTNTPSITVIESVPVNVSAAVVNLTLTEYVSSVGLNIPVAAGVDALVLAAYAATVDISGDVNVSAGTAALTLTEQPATISADINVSASLATLALTEQAATISADINVSAALATLALTEAAAGVSLGVVVSAGAGALTLAEQTAAVQYDSNVLAGTDALVLAAYQAAVLAQVDVEVSAGVAPLVLTVYAANVGYGITVHVPATTAALMLASHAAAVKADRNVLAALAALGLSEYAAAVSVGFDAVPAAFVSAYQRVKILQRGREDHEAITAGTGRTRTTVGIGED